MICMESMQNRNTFGDTVCRQGKSYQRTVLMRVIGLYDAVSESLYSINITFGDPPLSENRFTENDRIKLGEDGEQ
jgi:hypothetical protein